MWALVTNLQLPFELRDEARALLRAETTVGPMTVCQPSGRARMR